MDERASNAPDSTWITSAFVVGKSTPFRSGIDDSVTPDEPTITADHISRPQFFNDVIIVAFRTHQADV